MSAQLLLHTFSQRFCFFVPHKVVFKPIATRVVRIAQKLPITKRRQCLRSTGKLFHLPSMAWDFGNGSAQLQGVYVP